MSSDVFPTLPGRDIAIERSSGYETSIFKTVSGKEQRLAWRTTGEVVWKVRYNILREWVLAPAPWAAYSEVGVVLRFWDAHKGDYDSFLYDFPATDNTNGVVQARVRFESQSLRFKRIAERRWECDFNLIAVPS